MFLAFLLYLYDYKKTKLVITPISYFSLVNIFSLLYPVFSYDIYPYGISRDAVSEFLFIHSVQMLLFAMVYILTNPSVCKYSGFKSFPLNGSRSLNGQLALLFFALYITSFILLMISSGAGLMWILDSREAYQRHREGVGVIYSFSILFFYFSYVLSLSYYKNKLCVLLVFLVMANFFGSKGVIVVLFVVFYYFVKLILNRRVGRFFIALSIVALLGIMYKLMTLLESGFLFSFFKYFDYIINSAYFYDSFSSSNSDHINGYGFISDLYTFIPRSIYSEKPFAYGSVLITDFLWPGLAERGITPGKVDYLIWYYDFGFSGVFIFTFLKAFLLKILFYKSIENTNLSGLIIFMAVCGLPLFKYGGLGPNIIFAMLFSLFYLILIRVSSKGK